MAKHVVGNTAEQIQKKISKQNQIGETILAN